MAKKKTRPVDPVIVVPGITATSLHDEYPTGHENVWGLLKKDYERIVLHPDDTRFEAVEPARVRVSNVFEVAYRELIEELRFNLRGNENLPVPVYPFAYDWRMPLAQTAKVLGEFVDEVIDRTKLLRHYHESGYGDRPQVNLVGHSMGGLIIAGYLSAAAKESRVNKVVTLATPFRGSYEAVMKIATGYAELGPTPSASRERDAARITPALYHLLPSFEDCISTDPGIPASLFDPATWQPSVINSIAEFIRFKGLPAGSIKGRAEKLFSDFLIDAKKFIEGVEAFRLKDAGLDNRSWLAVVGVDATTRVHIKVIKKNREPEFSILPEDRVNRWHEKDQSMRRMTGDGTVPFEGAVPSFLKEENLVCVTPEDFGYWEMADKILTVAGGFHAMLPNMNMIHRLIIRFLKEQPDKRKNTWGRKAPGVDMWDPPLDLSLEEDRVPSRSLG